MHLVFIFPLTDVGDFENDQIATAHEIKIR